MLELKTEHLFDLQFTAVSDPQKWFIVGDGGWGTRIIIPVAMGGTFAGPKIKGTLKVFGADWLLIRHDSVPVPDVRMILETDDGALIHMYYSGILRLSEEEIKRVTETGELPPETWVHTTPRFETGHEKYLWLNRVMAAAIGKLVPKDGDLHITYSIYALK